VADATGLRTDPDDDFAGWAFVNIGEVRLAVERAELMAGRARVVNPELAEIAERSALWMRHALDCAEELWREAARRADRPLRPAR